MVAERVCPQDRGNACNGLSMAESSEDSWLEVGSRHRESDRDSGRPMGSVMRWPWQAVGRSADLSCDTLHVDNERRVTILLTSRTAA